MFIFIVVIKVVCHYYCLTKLYLLPFFQCIADSKFIHYIKPHSPPLHDHHNEHNHHKHHHDHNHHDSEQINSNNCTNSTEGCTDQTITSEEHHRENEYLNYALNQEDIVNVCPVLLYQLSSELNSATPGCVDKELLVEIDERELKKYHHNNQDILWGK